MKKTILFIVIATLLLNGCGKMDPDSGISEEALYIGTVSVLYNGETVNNENIKVRFAPKDDGTAATIKIYRIRFVPKMPVRVDVTIPDITIDTSGDRITFSCDEVIPLALGGEYPKYIVTDLAGEVVGNELEFSLKFGEYPTSFTGRLNQ